MSVLCCKPLFKLKRRSKWDAVHRTVEFFPARFATESFVIYGQLIIFVLDHDASLRNPVGVSLKAYDALFSFNFLIFTILVKHLGD